MTSHSDPEARLLELFESLSKVLVINAEVFQHLSDVVSGSKSDYFNRLRKANAKCADNLQDMAETLKGLEG